MERFHYEPFYPFLSLSLSTSLPRIETSSNQHASVDSQVSLHHDITKLRGFYSVLKIPIESGDVLDLGALLL